MDTAKIMTASRMRRIRAEEHAAAMEQWEALLQVENRAAIVMYLLDESGSIVSHRRTFVNEENTTDSSVVFFVFLYTMHKCMQKHTNCPYSPSKTVLQAFKTLLMMGTQVWLP